MAEESKVQIVPNTAIGIDLGTTFARVAVWQNGKVTIISNERGNKKTPNYVGFTNNSRLVGESAKKQVSVNYKNTILAGKRLLGCSFSGKEVQETLNFQAFQVVSHEGQPKLNVQYNGETKQFAPEEISAMMLIKMKEIAEVHLGTAVKDAVITVPSCFNQCQRQATLNAGTIAGLNILRILNEPTAAALAYELDKNFIDVETLKNVLFFCMGGGATSVSVISIDNGSSFEVKATAGDTHLGGEDFDNKLVTYCMNEFKRKHKKNLDSGSKAIFRLKTACEKAKRSLSSCNETSIVVDCLLDDIDFVMDITRSRFEEICFDLFQSTVRCVAKVLKDAKLKKSEIHDVVLVGGCTKIPKIQALLRNYFNGKELNNSQVMDESVVFGAAIQAAVLSGIANGATPKVNVLDVTPFTLGWPSSKGLLQTVFQRGSKIPFTITQAFAASVDNQIVLPVTIMEEYSTLIPFRNKIGSFRLEIPPGPARTSEALCSFELDANGIFHVFRTLDAINREEIAYLMPGSQLSQEEIVRMTSDALTFKEKEDRDKELRVSRNQLEAFITDLKQTFHEGSAIAAAKYTEVMNLLDNHKLTNKSLVASKHKEIQNELLPLLKKLKKFHKHFDHEPCTPKIAQPDDSTQNNGGPTPKKSRQT